MVIDATSNYSSKAQKLTRSPFLKDKKYQSFLGLVKENKKQLFTNDKFYAHLEAQGPYRKIMASSY